MSEEKYPRAMMTTVAAGESITDAEGQPGFTISIGELLIKLVEKWYWIALSAIVCAIAVIVYTNQFVTPKYVATSKIYVANSKDSVIDVTALQLANYLTNDYLQIFDNWEMHEQVLQKLGLDCSYKKISEMISVTNPQSTRVLVIRCTSSDALEAQRIANAYAEVAVDFFPDKMDTSSPKLFEKALLPTTPTSPNRSRNALYGFLFGLIIAVAALVLRFLMDDYVRTEDDVERYLNLPTLGTMMLQKDDKMFDSVDEDYDVQAMRRRK